MSSVPKAISVDCKFSALAIVNVRAELSSSGTFLPDGTQVLTRFPFELEAHWGRWLGSTVIESLKDCNLVFLRTATGGWTTESVPVVDDVNARLREEVLGLFSVLRLIDTIEYDSAVEFDGYLKSGQSYCRTSSRLEHYGVTRGYFPWTIREADLLTAANLYAGRKELLKQLPDPQRWRIWRGYDALNMGLEHPRADNRLHSFIRALEALILHEAGKTEKQFVSRCLIFAAPNANQATARAALQEAYRMRSDVEHLHEWDRSLANAYPSGERQDVALLRTRQMERLACWAYRQILTNCELQKRFSRDADVTAFWALPEADIQTAFGTTCDITELGKVSSEKCNGIGRAHPSEWPAHLRKW